MSRMRLAYVGGGSTRAPAVAAGLVRRAAAFAGSEVALIDLDEGRLDVILRLARRLAEEAGADLRFEATTDRRAGLRDATMVLTSFRPGGFEARALDEAIPLRHGVIGQETQGPGGLMMAMRAVHALRPMLGDIEAACPRAHLLNYTNPVNVVAEAVTRHAGRDVISLCEGPVIFPREVAEAAGLDPEGLDVTMIGLNHASWSTRARLGGADLVALVRAARAAGPAADAQARRLLHMTDVMGAVPAQYFKYYYFRDEILAELRAAPAGRAETIMRDGPGYWAHYDDVATGRAPTLDLARSRGGMDLLEIAVDVMDAIVNDRREVWPVNVPNRGAVAGLPEDCVVEVPGLVDARGARPVVSGAIPSACRPLVMALAEYQRLAADAAWSGERRALVHAMAANPLVPSLPVAEALVDEMVAAHAAHLPPGLAA